MIRAALALVLLASCGQQEPDAALPEPDATPPGLGEALWAQLTEDADCSVTHRQDGNEHIRRYHWSSADRALNLQAQGHTYLYHYDEAGRLLSREELATGPRSPAWRQSFTYDDHGNVASYSSAGSHSEYRNQYDQDRLVLQELAPGPGLPPTSRTIFEYDGQGRLHHQVTHDGSGRMVDERTWTFRADGRIDTIDRHYLHPPDRSLSRYQYDGAGRLAQVTVDGGPYLGGPEGTIDVTDSWTYSPKGRITDQEGKGAQSDVLSEGTPRHRQFDLGCARFQARFPGIFALPAEQSFP